MSDNKPREYYGNWMALESTLEYAKDQTPKPEWVDIKCFVEKQAYTDALNLIEEMAGALEHESAHYTADNGVCAWDKTTTKALESYRKFKGG